MHETNDFVKNDWFYDETQHYSTAWYLVASFIEKKCFATTICCKYFVLIRVKNPYIIIDWFEELITSTNVPCFGVYINYFYKYIYLRVFKRNFSVFNLIRRYIYTNKFQVLYKLWNIKKLNCISTSKIIFAIFKVRYFDAKIDNNINSFIFKITKPTFR